MGMDGTLMKLGTVRKSWKSRHFTLDGLRLSYASEPGGRPKGQLLLHACEVVSLPDSNTFEVRALGRVMVLQSSSTEDAQRWIATISSCAARSPVVKEGVLQKFHDSFPKVRLAPALPTRMRFMYFCFC